MDSDIDTFADRYATVWNEPDPELRRKRIAELWAEDAVECTPTSEYRGHVELEPRVTAAYEQFVAGGQHVFTYPGGAVAHHGAVLFPTHMVPPGGGDPAWTGTVFVLLGEDGRITRDYQFTDPSPA
ncbi:nuclear transport factor 2 family protein [Amycolatopsis cynarae]|uniref:Nuclear transport factor 2 family protein n=1 Tax=Amycolatopsis cynarae TaxID=2995223 RepID=A0ABY7AU18_9PSEU|nr:nuclear transport factor 2 family protein [Amycolatopsis sp. HUAS 11-8]WAL63454.1 nuclear transport factor 2 family protein [Amycolatopsis sp. HUAS 11-8]